MVAIANEPLVYVDESTGEEFRNYACEYEYAGSRWGFDIMATNHGDAQERLRRMASGKVLGTTVADVPVKVGPLVRLICLLRNGFAKFV